MSILEVQAVCKSFGGVRALNDCSLTVEQGTITGLIGPNGSGKTTLFNVITGYERIDTGEIRFEGNAISKKSAATIFGLGIGRTFQLTRIFSRLTVLENMHVALPRDVKGLLNQWGAPEEKSQALDLLAFMNLTRLKDEPAGNLSYGQKKLLEFALILVAKPQVILLDEPAGGVNPTMINELTRNIRILNEQRKITFLVVEHNMDFVMRLCHTVYVMHHGTVIADGPPDDIRKNPRVLDAYLGV